MSNQEILAQRMLNYRAKHNLSQEKLGALLGVSIGTIYRCEVKQCKLQKIKEIRISNMLKELEEKDNVEM